VTETEWLAATDLSPLIQCLFRKLDHVSGRKMRLFGCACCRQIWPMLVEDRSRKAVELAEAFADALVSRKELAAIRADAFAAAGHIQRACAGPGLAMAARAAAQTTVANGAEAGRSASNSAAQAVASAKCYGEGGPERQPLEVWYREIAREHRRQVSPFRDVFGNPFRPVQVDPAWTARGHEAVQKLARRIAEEASLTDLPVLADVLDAAGCTAAALVDHCRRPGKHVRGCWVLDLVLERT
jgi:hypothetical protein